MAYCDKYNQLSQEDRANLDAVIAKRMCGKSHIADILVNPSKLEGYEFHIEVWKFSPGTGRGWSTCGYAKKKKDGDWTVNMNPTKGANELIGRTNSYS